MAALRGDKTLAELAEQYDLHPMQISEWKTQLAESAGLVFAKGKRPASGGEEAIKALQAKTKPYHLKQASGSVGAWRKARSPMLQTVLDKARLHRWGLYVPSYLVAA